MGGCGVVEFHGEETESCMISVSATEVTAILRGLCVRHLSPHVTVDQ